MIFSEITKGGISLTVHDTCNKHVSNVNDAKSI